MVTDAVLTVKRPGKPLDLLMIEQMEMITKDAMDSKLVRGLVCITYFYFSIFLYSIRIYIIIHVVIVDFHGVGYGSRYPSSRHAQISAELLYSHSECVS